MSTLSELQAIRAELGELAEQVRELTVREIRAQHYFNVGYEAGQQHARDALLGRAAASQTARPRPGHLRMVSDDTA